MNDKPAPRSITRISTTLTWLLVIALAAAAVGTWLARVHWLADLLANLRVQQLIALCVAMVLCGLHRLRLGAVIVVAVTAIHAPAFRAAFVSRDCPSVAESPALTVTFANVLTSNSRHEEIVADVASRDPDVIVILELSSGLATKLQTNLSQDYPHQIVRPQDRGNFGIGLFSKHPLSDAGTFKLNLEIESIEATVLKDRQPYRMYATHTLPPMSGRGFTARNEHLSQLADRITSYRSRSPGIPCALVGDLNLTPWSPWFDDLQRRSGLVRAGHGWSVAPTWYSLPSFPFGLVLDHGLISDELCCASVQIGPEIGSDHRSVTQRYIVRSAR